MKNVIFLAVLAFVASSCHYTIYDMNGGELKIAKKAAYTVNYATITPNNTPAEISYTDKDRKQHTDKHIGGRWDKSIEIPSGTDIKFTVKVKLQKTTPPGNLITTIKVDGETVSEQVQTGKKVSYAFGFKLP